MNGAKVIQVIEANTLRGEGTPSSPMRTVIEYWSLEGRKLAENDPQLGFVLGQVDDKTLHMIDALLKHGRDTRA